MTQEELNKLNVVVNGVTYTPDATCERKVGDDGNITFDWTLVKTAEEVASELINSAPQKAQPTNEETLSKEVANIKIDNMKKDAIITNALQTIASLKVEVINLKGGNA